MLSIRKKLLRKLGLSPSASGRHATKCLASVILYHTGLTKLAFDLLKRLDSRHHLVVLAYHKVMPRSLIERFDGVSEENFNDQVEVFNRLFRIVAPQELPCILSGKKGKENTYPLLFTFDDGYVNNLRYALPALKRRKLQCLFFITSDFVGTGRHLWPDEVCELLIASPKDRLHLRLDGKEEVYELGDSNARKRVASAIKGRLKKLLYSEFVQHLDDLRKAVGVSKLEPNEGTRICDWNEVKELEGHGMCIGSHTSRHFILSNLPDTELMADIKKSHATITSQLGASPRFIAYPNGHPGDYDRRVTRFARQLGFSFGFTMVSRVAGNLDDPMELPRFAPGNEPGAMVALDLLRLLGRQLLRRSIGREHGLEAPPLPSLDDIQSQDSDEDIPVVPALDMKGEGEFSEGVEPLSIENGLGNPIGADGANTKGDDLLVPEGFGLAVEGEVKLEREREVGAVAEVGMETDPLESVEPKRTGLDAEFGDQADIVCQPDGNDEEMG